MSDRANKPTPSLSRKESKLNKQLANKRTRRDGAKHANHYKTGTVGDTQRSPGEIGYDPYLDADYNFVNGMRQFGHVTLAVKRDCFVRGWQFRYGDYVDFHRVGDKYRINEVPSHSGQREDHWFTKEDLDRMASSYSMYRIDHNLIYTGEWRQELKEKTS